MSEIAIRCDKLSKQYQLGQRESYKALRDVITERVARPFQRISAALNGHRENGRTNGEVGELETRNWKLETQSSFWALKDVSFDVTRGEVVGVIGKNGAGKSTLLKILSRITKPTLGHAEIHGRVGSLLEVGTGFHPELTGRENIYLNAAILGMRKAEVERKFDEIVAFAEVERFVDTPVKRYSSGMYMRLAFAVAAHLEPEILVIDEVLAVGDAAFQKKCLGKMGEVAQGGRTVLFVSHNMDAILRLCTSAILLKDGIISTKGDVATTVDTYLLDHSAHPDLVDLRSLERARPIRGEIRFNSVRLLSSSTSGGWSVPFGEPLSFQVEFEVSSDVAEVDLAVALSSSRGFELASCLSSHSTPKHKLGPGTYSYTVEYKNLKLVPGYYRFGLALRSNFGFEDRIVEAFEVRIMPSELSSALNVDMFHGAMVPDADFKLSSGSRELPTEERFATL
jgi:lipopolysaccharide transport system ATP-binding protein